MRLSVVHETLYRYDQAVDSSHHLAHLSPQSDAMQTVHAHRLDIDPAPDSVDLTQRLDHWGNLATHWFMAQAHPHLRVTACSQIETQVCPEAHSEISCQEASRVLQEELNLGRAEALRWVYPSPRVPQHPEFSDLARPDLVPERPLVEAAVALMRRLHGQFTYDVHSTQVDTPALSALRAQRGVCQDFAHIMLAGLRQMGQAACYVSGYLLTHPPLGQARLRGADASHAWVALHIPNLNDHPSRGWLHLDPTNARHGWGSPGADYVVLSRGRDFSDVSPLRGVLRGGSDSAPQVSVHVEPL